MIIITKEHISIYLPSTLLITWVMHDKNCHKIIGNLHENQPCGMYDTTSSLVSVRRCVVCWHQFCYLLLLCSEAWPHMGVNLQMQTSFVCLAMFKYFVPAPICRSLRDLGLTFGNFATIPTCWYFKPSFNPFLHSSLFKGKKSLD